jgi:hypothetical protein
MNKTFFYKSILCAFVFGIFLVNAGNPPAPVVDKKAEKRKADSIANSNLYTNFTTDTKDYTFQNTPNEILLTNGMKIKFVKLNRFVLPRGVNVIIPDEMSQRFGYELAEVEIQATNTTSAEVKLTEEMSNSLFTSLKLFGTETGSKVFTSQYPLSFGSVYSMTEPPQTEKLTAVYKETKAMMNAPYKPGETKTSKGIIVCVAKAAKHIDKIVVNTQEFGTNKAYGCPVVL